MSSNEIRGRGLLSTPGPPYSARVTRTDGAAIPEDHVIVLFGALGDLARRKLLPGLFHLDRAGLMPERYRIIGTSRKGGSEADFRKVAQGRDRQGRRPARTGIGSPST